VRSMRMRNGVVWKMTGAVVGIMDQMREGTDGVGYHYGEMYTIVLLFLFF